MNETQFDQVLPLIRQHNPAVVIVANPAPFELGQRVKVTRGGFRGDEGRVLRTQQADDGHWVVAVTLDSDLLFIGSTRCLAVTE